MSFRKIVVIPEKYGSTDFQTATQVVEVPTLAPAEGQIAVKVGALHVLSQKFRSLN